MHKPNKDYIPPATATEITDLSNFRMGSPSKAEELSREKHIKQFYSNHTENKMETISGTNPDLPFIKSKQHGILHSLTRVSKSLSRIVCKFQKGVWRHCTPNTIYAEILKGYRLGLVDIFKLDGYAGKGANGISNGQMIVNYDEAKQWLILQDKYNTIEHVPLKDIQPPRDLKRKVPTRNRDGRNRHLQKNKRLTWWQKLGLWLLNLKS